MILKRIVEFAERQEGALPSGYQPRFITKVIHLDQEGNFLGFIHASGVTRGKRTGQDRNEPQEAPRRASNVVPRLIADNVNYVLGKAREKDKPEQVAARHLAWKELIAHAAEKTALDSVKVIHKWILQGGPEALREDDSLTEDDDLTFMVGTDYPTDDPVIRNYWAGLGESEHNGICLITGSYGPITDRMPAPIKGVPDGQMSGTALVSVNNAAGESYGLSAALNSPISPAAAEKLCNGLNILINDRVAETTKDGKPYERGKYSLKVGKSLFVAWTREEVEWDPFDMLRAPSEVHVRQLINAVNTGKQVDDLDEKAFYVLSLSANAARVVVREYHELTVGKVRKGYARWFNRLRLISPQGSDLPPRGAYALAASLYRDASKELPKHVSSDLVNAALGLREIPYYVLGLAVKRNFAMQGPFNLTPAKTKVLAYGRLALIKAVLTPDPEDQSLVMLNTDHPNPAYHYGRLLAVLEAIQKLAIPGLNASLVDRNYGAACTSPASVFSNLVKDATIAHLPKLRKSRPGAYSALDGRMREVMGHFTEYKKTLTLDDQGLFSLGYYHQRADDIAAALKNKELKELADQDLSTEETES